MGRNLPLSQRLFATGFFLVIVLFLPTGTRADEVTIAGSTAGCFGLGCTPAGTGQIQTSSLLGLTFNGSILEGTTSGGFLAAGDTASPFTNVNNLGSFTLSASPNTYNGQAFTLRITFTAPQGITGGQQATFSASLVGSVSATEGGGVLIDFDNAPILFTFSNANGTGFFLLSINDVSVAPGGTMALSGTIMSAEQASIPEPATLLLLGSGLVAVAGGLRRRRSRIQVR